MGMGGTSKDKCQGKFLPSLILGLALVLIHAKDACIHIPESISADVVGSLLFLSHAQCLLEAAHERPYDILNHEFTRRV